MTAPPKHGEPLLVAEGLVKVFRGWRGKTEVRAVDGVNLCVRRGDVFGFLGPNGAGKSTTIRMILGLIHPTEGRVLIDGHDLQTDRLSALRKVGAFVEAPSFYTYLTGRQNLEIFAGLSGGVERAEMDRIVELVGLRGRVDEPVKVYSHGMRQRLGIAACLLPRPELMVLDEPTDGLDPHGIRETSELIKRLLEEEGLTVFLSSHLLAEVENVCSRIAILEKGRVLVQGDLDDIKRQFCLLEVHVDRSAEAARLVAQRTGAACAVNASGAVVLPLDAVDHAELNALLMGAGFRVSFLGPERGWLERIFVERTTPKEPRMREAAGAESNSRAGNEAVA